MPETTPATEPNADETLAAMIPEENEITIGAESFRITPFKLGQYPRVLKHIYRLMMYVGADGKLDFTAAFMNEGEAVIAVMAEAVKKPVTWFDELDSDKGFELLAMVVYANMDFFVRRVLPTLEQMTARITASMPTAETPESPEAGTIS